MAVKIDEIIRFHRKKARLTQAELSDLAGLGKTVVFDVEHGKETVKWSTLLKLFKVLNVRIKFESPLMAKFEEDNNADS